MSYITDKIKEWSTRGFQFWYAYDPTVKQSSVTLFFCYVTFWIAIGGSLAVYFKPDLLTASINSTVFWVAAFIFYRLRKLDTVKLDLDDRSLELSGNDGNENN